jgi:multidrug efflux pump subunit AcrA (membrane-fusion protein)
MTGRVRVALEKRADAVLVPEQALFDAQGSKAVYVVTSDNMVALHNVVTEGSYQGKSVITQGLAGGETVIVDGIARVRAGQPVTAKKAPSVPGR